MKRRLLHEALDALQEEFLAEYDFMAGPGMIDRPEAAGDRSYNTLKGSPKNFCAFDDNGPEWPYEDDGEVNHGVPSWEGGRGAWGRGDRPGSDVSGGPPTQRYGSTWAGGPDEVEEGADWDELQRHGTDKVRDVWRDTPEGKGWAEMNNEAMGQPTQIGPVAPMDGPQHHTGRDADPVEDEGGRPITQKSQFQLIYAKDMSGPAGQWGGPETIPGQSRGWAEPPFEGESSVDPWKPPEESVREFFDPSPVSAEAVTNPAQDYLGDQNDDEIDGGFTGRLGGTSIFVLPRSGPSGEFVATPGRPGSSRGTFGIHVDGKDAAGDLVSRGSAWDVIQRIVQALSAKNSGDTAEEA